MASSYRSGETVAAAHGSAAGRRKGNKDSRASIGAAGTYEKDRLVGREFATVVSFAISVAIDDREFAGQENPGTQHH